MSDTALIAKLTKLLERDNPAWGPVRIAEVTPVFGGTSAIRTGPQAGLSRSSSLVSLAMSAVSLTAFPPNRAALRR